MMKVCIALIRAKHVVNEVHTDADSWRCSNCIESGLEADPQEGSEKSADMRRSSIPKMSRDLLPTSRGVHKPDSHSIFDTLVLPDEPIDGPRALRKRRMSHEDDPPVRPSRRRRRTSEAPSDLSDASSRAPKSSQGRRRTVSVVETDGAQDVDSEDGSPRARTTRPRRAVQQRKLKPGCTVSINEDGSFMASFKFTGRQKEKVVKILTSRPRKKKLMSARERARKAQLADAEPEVSHYPSIQTNFQPLFSFHDREMDEKNQKPYGGILDEAEADTSKTFPQAVDRQKFEDARLKAEEDWKKKMAAIASNNPQEANRTPAKSHGPPSKIRCINFGGYEIDTWHAAPYPEEYTRNKVLYICEFCLKYMSSDYVAWRHKVKSNSEANSEPRTNSS
jgi:histone acetyltransferase SAS3